MVALGVGPGDEVLVPSLSFVATANAVRYCGGTPVFVEIRSPDDLTLCLDDAARKVTCDLRGLRAFADRSGIFYVEDAAQSAGASRDGVACGASGDLACFSFYSTKNATTAEGGMVTAQRDDLADRIRRLRSHGMTATVLERDRGEKFGYDVVALGYNYRIDEIRAAIGRVQIRRLPASNERRRELTARYVGKLDAVPGLSVPFRAAPGRSAHHLMPVLLPPGTDRSRVAAAMRARGVQTSVHYRPIHQLTYYRETQGTGDGLLPRTEEIAARELTLPLYAALTEAQQDHVVGSLAQALGG
jgi:dTDP-4-amino-4,6-dideoxygalactose transaminase